MINLEKTLDEKNILIKELTYQLKFSNSAIKQLKQDMEDLIEIVTDAIDKIDYHV